MLILAHNEENIPMYKRVKGRISKNPLPLIIHIQFHHITLWMPLSYYLSENMKSFIRLLLRLFFVFMCHISLYPVSILTIRKILLSAKLYSSHFRYNGCISPPFIYPGIPLISHWIPWSATLFGIFPNKINDAIQRNTDICILHKCVFI